MMNLEETKSRREWYQRLACGELSNSERCDFLKRLDSRENLGEWRELALCLVESQMIRDELKQRRVGRSLFGKVAYFGGIAAALILGVVISNWISPEGGSSGMVEQFAEKASDRALVSTVDQGGAKSDLNLKTGAPGRWRSEVRQTALVEVDLGNGEEVFVPMRKVVLYR